jgi:polyhydroxyalkanoate synthesis regulator phasin
MNIDGAEDAIIDFARKFSDLVEKHFKEIKSQMNELCEEINGLKKEIQAIEEKSKLGFGIILEDEED